MARIRADRAGGRRRTVAWLVATACLAATWSWPVTTDAIGGGAAGTVPGLARLDVAGTPVCSASLVRSNWALTAAHCVVSDTAIDATIATIVSASGRRSVTEIVVHPDFDPATPTSAADLALLRLSTASSDAIAVMAAAEQPAVQGDSVTLAGWGVLSDGSEPTTSQVGTATVLELGGVAGMFTTGDGASGCSGDSGGPAIVGDRLVGVLSASVSADCGSANLWVDVAAQRVWIDGVLGRDGAAPVVAGGALATPVDTSVAFTVDVADERPLAIGVEVGFVVSGGSVDSCDAETEPTTCRFVPTAGFVGQATIDVTAFDGTSIGSAAWMIQVGEGVVNQPPVFTRVDPLSSPNGEPVSFVLDVTDPDGTVRTMDDVTVTTTAGTVVCTDQLPATCTFTPRSTFTGTARVFATVVDGGQNYTLIVRIAVRVDLPPVVASGSITVDAGDTFQITFSALDDRLGQLGFEYLVDVQLGVFDAVDFSCDVVAVPVVCEFPTPIGRSFQETITVTFTDGVNESTGTWFIDVVSSNRPPVISSPTAGQIFRVVEGFPFEIPMSFSDPDGDPLVATDAQLLLPVESLGCTGDGGSLACGFHAPLAGGEVMDGLATVSDPFGATSDIPFAVEVVPWNGARLSVDDVDVTEPFRGRQRVSIVLQLDAPAVGTVSMTVQPDFAASTATSADVIADAATLTFRRGSTRATYVLTVRSDAAIEDVESLALRLTSGNIALGRGMLQVVIAPAGV